MFISQQTYVGGADALFDYFVVNFNGGQPLNTRCSSCVGGVLLDCSNMIKEYERNM